LELLHQILYRIPFPNAEDPGGDINQKTVPPFHFHVQTLVNSFDDGTAPIPTTVWRRSYFQTTTFVPALGPPYVEPIFAYSGGFQHFGPGWYGDLPNPIDPTDDPTQSGVFDPRYTLPAYLYALQSWLTIHSLLRTMDASENSFIYFLTGDYLARLTNQPPYEELTLPPPDNTKANANWSVRELYNYLNEILQGSAPIWPSGAPGPTKDYEG
jgi:hypothetical protein